MYCRHVGRPRRGVQERRAADRVPAERDRRDRRDGQDGKRTSEPRRAVGRPRPELGGQPVGPGRADRRVHGLLFPEDGRRTEVP